jgi:hypothetical protein
MIRAVPKSDVRQTIRTSLALLAAVLLLGKGGAVGEPDVRGHNLEQRQGTKQKRERPAQLRASLSASWLVEENQSFSGPTRIES